MLSQTHTIKALMSGSTSLLVMASPLNKQIDDLLTDMNIGSIFKVFFNADKAAKKELKAEQKLGLSFCSAFIHCIEAIATCEITPGTSILNVTNQIYNYILNHPSVKPFVDEPAKKRVRRQEHDVLYVTYGLWNLNKEHDLCPTEKLRNELQVMKNCVETGTSNFAINMRTFSQTSRDEIGMIIGQVPRADNGLLHIQDKSTKAKHINRAYAKLPKEDQLKHGYQAPEVLRRYDFSSILRLPMFETLKEDYEQGKDEESDQVEGEQGNMNIETYVTSAQEPFNESSFNEDEEKEEDKKPVQEEDEEKMNMVQENLSNVMMSGTDAYQQDEDEHLHDTTSNDPERDLAELAEQNRIIQQHVQQTYVLVKKLHDIRSDMLMYNLRSVSNHGILTAADEQELTVLVKEFQQTWFDIQAHINSDQHAVMKSIFTDYAKAFKAAHNKEMARARIIHNGVISDVHVITVMQTIAATEISLLQPDTAVAESDRSTPAAVASSNSSGNSSATNNTNAAATARLNALTEASFVPPPNVVAQSERSTPVAHADAAASVLAPRSNVTSVPATNNSTSAATSAGRLRSASASADAQGADCTVTYPAITEIDFNNEYQQIIEINSSSSDNNDDGEESSQNTNVSYESLSEPDWEHTEAAVAAAAAVSTQTSNVTSALVTNNSSSTAASTGLPPPTPRANSTTAPVVSPHVVPTNVTPNVTTANATAATNSSGLKAGNIIIARSPTDSLTIPHQNDLVPDFELINKIQAWEIAYLPSRIKPDPKTNQDVQAPPFLNISSIRNTLAQHPEFAEVFHVKYLSTCVPRRTLNLYMKATKPNKSKKRKLLRSSDQKSAESSNKKRKTKSPAPPQNEHLSPN